MPEGKIVTILHFNDVYDLDPRPQGDPAGGVTRFATLLKELREKTGGKVFFGGDALSPSIVSNFTQGKHMVEVLNAVQTDVAVIGNHDFDFGVDNLCEALEESNFPWLLSNVTDLFTDEPLANAPVSTIVEVNGVKIGVMGLVEEEWIVTLSTVDDDQILVEDHVDKAKELSAELRSQGCNVVVAITHMRWPNNLRILHEAPEVDLVLSGHDHFYRKEEVDGRWAVVSGTDFQYITEVTLQFDKDSQLCETKLTAHAVNRDVPEDPDMLQLIDKYVAEINAKKTEVLTYFGSDLDGRFMTIRSQESNLGNVICDAAASATNADCCLINGGTFRSDRIHAAGPFTYGDLMSILPFLDSMVLISVTGEQLVLALENGVSQYPRLEGRFPQVSGISFAFDPRKPPGQRVEKRLVQVQEEPLDMEREYRLVTKAYIAGGKDGYDCLASAEVLVDDENSPKLPMVVQNYCNSVQFICRMKKQKSQHHQPLFSRRSSAVRRRISTDMTSTVAALDNRKSRMVRQRSVQDMETERVHRVSKPKVEGRIRIIENDEIDVKKMRNENGNLQQKQMLLAYFNHPEANQIAAHHRKVHAEIIREESEDNLEVGNLPVI